MDFKSYRIPYQGRSIYINNSINNTTSISTRVSGGVVNVTPSDTVTTTENQIIQEVDREWYNIKTRKRSFTLDYYMQGYTEVCEYVEDGVKIWQHIFEPESAQGLMYDRTTTVWRKSSSEIIVTTETIDSYQYIHTIFNNTSYVSNIKTVDRYFIAGRYDIVETTESGNLTDYVSPFRDTSTMTPSYGTRRYNVLSTLIENYDSDIKNNDEYRLVLLKWKRGTKEGKGWRTPMFSPLWDHRSDNGRPLYKKTVCQHLWEECSWPVDGAESRFFGNTGRLVDWDILDKKTERDGFKQPFFNGLEWIPVTPYRFKLTHSNKMRFGVAIYKKTGVGEYGWQRVSNIAEVEIYVTRGNDFVVCPKF